MAKVIIEVISSQGIKRDLHIIESDNVSVGRDYTNDLILNDPYVSEKHLTIQSLEDGKFLIEDLESLNGSYNISDKTASCKKQRFYRSHEVVSGANISLGHTVIRIFHPDHTVPDTRIMKRLKMFTLSLSKKTTTWYVLLGCFILYFFDAAAKNAYVEHGTGIILFAELFSVFGILIWSGGWSLIGRMIRHKANFRIHFTLAYLYILVMLPVTNISAYLGYIFANPLIEIILLMIFYSSGIALLLYGHKSYATLLNVRTRIISSVAIPTVICFFIVLGYFSFSDSFSITPPYYPRLKPPILKPVKVHNIDDFINNIDEVFTKAEDLSNANSVK